MTIGRRVNDPRDAYDTPPEVTRAFLMAWLLSLKKLPAYIWEPAAGAGAMLEPLKEAFPFASALRASDIAPRASGVSVVDFLGSQADSYNLIITNPPYNKALEFAQHGLERVTKGGHVVLLLRLAFLESQKRSAWLRENMPERVYVLSKRPSFDGKGTDSAAYAWFVWRKGHHPDHAELRLVGAD